MRFLLAFALVALVVGCTVTGSTRTKDDSVPVGVGGANHTERFIYRFYVNGVMGHNKEAYSAASASSCCVMLPKTWRQGLKVVVDWDMPRGIQHNWKRKEVEVEQYSAVGDVYVHFFPNDEIRAVVSIAGPRNPNYPIPLPVDPRMPRTQTTQEQSQSP